MRNDLAERMRVLERFAADPVPQVDDLAREILRRGVGVGIERQCGQSIGARRATDAQVDSPRGDRFEDPELLRHLERRVMRQHHPGAADANARRGRGNASHQDFRCGADDAAAVMMFGDPVAVVAERVAVAREHQRFANGIDLGAALGSGGLIEHGQFHAGPRGLYPVLSRKRSTRMTDRGAKSCEATPASCHPRRIPT